MRTLILTVTSLLLLVSCGGEPPSSNPSGHQSEGEPEDYCERFGWYGDGHCDEICTSPDPDCAGPGPTNGISGPGPGPGPQPEPTPTPLPEPDPEPTPSCDHLFSRGDVKFVSEDPAQCQVIFFACEEGQIAFDDADCGCGCIDPWSVGTACLDDSKPDVERLGDQEFCALADFVCAEGWTYFYDDCGCGCRLVCSDDFECPNGYCELGVDDLPMCVYPNCDDGSEVLCDALPPVCYDTDVAAVRNGCWECVDARTCGPSMGP